MLSRITIVVDVESAPLEQIVKQLFKLVDVVKISELDPRRSVERELLHGHRSGAGRGPRAGSWNSRTIFEGKFWPSESRPSRCLWREVPTNLTTRGTSSRLRHRGTPADGSRGLPKLDKEARLKAVKHGKAS